MSAKVMRFVYESDLAPSLKPVAGLLALFGNEDGERIFPSVDRIAWMAGMTRRSAQRAMSQLRQMGIIVPETSTRGGRKPGGGGLTVRYSFNLAAFPERAPFQPRRACLGSGAKGDVDAAVEDAIASVSASTATSETPRVTLEASRVTFGAFNGDASVTRSVRDRSEGSTVGSTAGALSRASRSLSEKNEETKNENQAHAPALVPIRTVLEHLQEHNPTLAAACARTADQQRRAQQEGHNRRRARRGAQ